MSEQADEPVSAQFTFRPKTITLIGRDGRSRPVEDDSVEEAVRSAALCLVTYQLGIATPATTLAAVSQNTDVIEEPGQDPVLVVYARQL